LDFGTVQSVVLCFLHFIVT